MRKNEVEDLALETLLAVRQQIAPNLSEALLRQCYAIQRRFQFLDDRTQSTIMMDRLIEEFIDASPLSAE